MWKSDTVFEIFDKCNYFVETAKGSVLRVSVLFFSYTPIPDKLSEGK